MDYLVVQWEAAKERYYQSLQNSDPRTKDWFLMQSPWPMLALFAGYLVMCAVGPRLMRNRKPFELNLVMIVYNLVMVGLSLHMFMELFLSTRALNFAYTCDLVDYEDRSEPGMRLASVIWLYFFSKVIEFLDTFFFILRKKDDQITFLHVYHHSTMVFLWWIGVRWYAGGSSFFSAMINCFVHVVMYTYYLLSALGPRVRKYLWWKKYLTGMQLMQFVMLLIHVTQSLYNGCAYDWRPQWALFFYLLSHIALFSNFYRHTYIKPKGNSDGGSDAALQKKARQKKEQ
ncbi:hypothetical protein EMCRGX_G008975 [Ephydatia muelleri]|eukprot:Em0003g310a